MVTIREVAQRLDVSPQAVLRWIATGKLPASREWYGQTSRFRYRIAVADVEQLLEATKAHRANIEG